MNHHDPHDPRDLGEDPGEAIGADDPTARRLRSGLDAAGRGLHAPAGIAAAALRGGRRRRRQRRAAVTTPLALIALAAAGLSWQRPWNSEQVRTVPAAEQVRDGQRAAATVEDVLAQLPIATRDGLDLGVSEQLLIDRCLTDQGVTIQRSPVAVDTGDRVGEAARRGRDVDDLSAWSTHASTYGVASSIRAVLTDPGTGQLGDFTDGVPDGYYQTLTGTPARELTLPVEDNGSLTVTTSGCAGQGVEQLYGIDAETYTRTYVAVRGLPEQLLEDVAGDSALRVPLEEWSQCMGTRGHQVATPADLPVQVQTLRRDLLTDKADGTRATEADLDTFTTAEAALASADRDCKDTSALGSAFAQALARHWAPLAEEHAGELAAYRQMLQHAHAVAAELNPVDPAPASSPATSLTTSATTRTADPQFIATAAFRDALLSIDPDLVRYYAVGTMTNGDTGQQIGWWMTYRDPRSTPKATLTVQIGHLADETPGSERTTCQPQAQCTDEQLPGGVRLVTTRTLDTRLVREDQVPGGQLQGWHTTVSVIRPDGRVVSADTRLDATTKAQLATGDSFDSPLISTEQLRALAVNPAFAEVPWP
ncbi:hypothetical protein FHR75_004146 [Kineococcus radiotolerans]|uniref:Uncharacterized protein n=1 Tax=Kineococcus radiotolerans TaxID=131568 RepID=A0A7W4XZH8_KINRA|nr:hypothetical protein [Kineococcus radiotolerans]MBB2903304.1 hypothetical protein [Kineococcus radiotolerans]